jgi:hypothetical protein
MLARVDAKIRIETKVSSEEAQGARNHPWLVAGGWWWWVWCRGGGGKGNMIKANPKHGSTNPRFEGNRGSWRTWKQGLANPKKGS